MSASCSSCGQPITWARTERGRLMPLDVEELDFAAPGLVVLNPARGTCRVLAEGQLMLVAGWRERGATVHRSHWDTCQSAEQHRVSPQQETLPL